MSDQTASAQPYPTEPCRSCQRPVIWAITATNLRPMPVDPEPTQGGNVALEPRPDGQQPLARVISVAKQFGRRDLRTSHFATCPEAGQWRTRTRRRTP